MAQILERLIENRHEVFGRVRAVHRALQVYDETLSFLCKTNVATDREYQRKFNRFYRVRQKPSAWYAKYFEILEQEKRNSQISFEQVLKRMFDELGRIEPSFSSKLVATIRPDFPVYDSVVLARLRISKPSGPPERRFENSIRAYRQIEAFHSQSIATEEFKSLKAAFDDQFGEFSHFSDVKKLDIGSGSGVHPKIAKLKRPTSPRSQTPLSPE